MELTDLLTFSAVARTGGITRAAEELNTVQSNVTQRVKALEAEIGTALFGFLMLPSVYLLGRELEDETLGLLAVFLAAISFWAVAISRVGLRFPLSPLFIAPALFLVLRGLRTGRRNDFLIAGVVLGISLFGYSPIRVLPIALAVVVGLFLLWPAARGRRRRSGRHHGAGGLGPRGTRPVACGGRAAQGRLHGTRDYLLDLPPGAGPGPRGMA